MPGRNYFRYMVFLWKKYKIFIKNIKEDVNTLRHDVSDIKPQYWRGFRFLKIDV